MDSEAVEDRLLAASSASRLVPAVPEDDAAAEGPALGSLILWVFTDVSRDVSRFAPIVLDDTVTVVSALLELFIFCEVCIWCGCNYCGSKVLLFC